MGKDFTMKCRLVGINRKAKWNYQGKSGENQRLYLNRIDSKLSGDQCEGYQCLVAKVPLSLDTSGLKAGDIVNIYYNQFGSVEFIEKAAQ